MFDLMGLSESDAVAKIRKAKAFHVKWYREKYRDVELIGMDPVTHYLRYGALMGRNPSKNFDTSFYLNSYPDIADRKVNPLLHFLLEGKEQGRYPRLRDRTKTEISLVDELIRKLWGGLRDFAVAKLQEMLEDDAVASPVRGAAGLALAVRFDFDGDLESAIRVLETVGKLSNDLLRSPRRLIPLSVLYRKLGRVSDAQQALNKIDPSTINTSAILAGSNLESDGTRLDLINTVFQKSGFSGIELLCSTRPLAIDNIRGQRIPCTLDVGKVSIIMPVYNAAEKIEAAIRSLTEQTYINLQIIVVDDCSVDDTYERVLALAASDDRILPIRQETNKGAYPARNRGLLDADGDFVTTHDADDWSHPQKIERQLHAMFERPNLMGTVVHWARVRPNLSFTTNWRLSDKIVHWSHSSFLFRKEVLDQLGPWDEVRVSADTEFIWRVQSAYGKDAVARLFPEVPLAFALDEETSLTRHKGTHVSTTYFGLRHYYWQISLYWLKRFPNGASPEERKMKLAMLPQEMFKSGKPPEDFDLLVHCDCRQSEMLERVVKILEERGPIQVGISHTPSADLAMPRNSDLQFPEIFFELIALGNVNIVLPDRLVQAKEIILA